MTIILKYSTGENKIHSLCSRSNALKVIVL